MDYWPLISHRGQYGNTAIATAEILYGLVPTQKVNVTVHLNHVKLQLGLWDILCSALYNRAEQR